MKIVDNSYNEKYAQIKFEESDEIKIKEYVPEENKELTIEENYYFLLKKKYDFSIRIINIIKELKGFSLLLISYFYYYLSLEACLKGQEICSTLVKWQLNKIYQELKSCILFVFVLELIFYKKLSKLHIIHFFMTFLLFYIYSHGTEFEDHGYYNFIYFFIIITLLVILLIPFNVIFYIIRKKKRKIDLFIYILSLIIIVYFFYFFIYIKGANCDDWGRGLNNTSIINNNSIYSCQIKFPKKCSYKLFYSFQDYTKIMGKNCTKKKKKKARENLIKSSFSPFINNETKRFGYPLTNKDPDSIKGKNRKALKNHFLHNLVDMDNKQILDKYFFNKIPEVSVDFTDNIQGKIEINIHHDKDLSKMRKILEKNSDPLFNNVLIIYIDSVSRQNAIRELKKTLEFFEKFMPYQGGFNKKYPNESYHSFEFLKYHAFEGCTGINYPLLFYGQKRKIKKKYLINKYFKENGYITSLAHDACLRDNTKSNHKFIVKEVFDHEFILCDPNKESINTNSIRCLYEKLDLEHLLVYTEQFWRKYAENRKFSLIVSNYGHEGSLQTLKYTDNLISNFLWNLFDDNLLKNCIVFLMSDHGAPVPSLYYFDEFYQIELRLPMLYIIVNDMNYSNYDQQYKYIHENQQTFITAFDIYNTLSHIIFGEKYKYIKKKTEKKDRPKSPYGESLFNEINNHKDRNPKSYNNLTKMSLYVCK